MYSQDDFDASRKKTKTAIMQALLIALPFAAAMIAGFVVRNEKMCIAGCVAAGAVIIFLWDMRISPALRYGRFLDEAHSGLTRETAGALMRIGEDEVYQDGCYFRELILNIYEDMSEDGERRFLLDCRKSVDSDLMGKDVVLTSHGNFVLNVRAMKTQADPA